MQNTERYSAVRKMAEVAVFSALLCVISPFAIPIGPVSITLATFGVYLSGAELGCKKGGAAVAVYLMLGFIGLPVFSGFMGGVQRLIGPTGGYLVGYIPCAMITGFFSRKFKRLWASAAGMALGTVVLYALGTAWFCLMSGTSLLPALSACVFPFLPGDAAKIACAALLGDRLRKLAERV